MLLQIYSPQEQHLEEEHQNRYRRFAFMTTYQGSKLHDLGKNLALAGVWPTLPKQTANLQPGHQISTEVGNIRYFAIGAYPATEDAWYESPESIRKAIALFCEGLNRLPVPKNKEHTVGVVLNPFKILRDTPIHTEYIQRQFINTTRPLAWFMH
jgi:hypothetical protein